MKVRISKCGKRNNELKKQATKKSAPVEPSGNVLNEPSGRVLFETEDTEPVKTKEENFFKRRGIKKKDVEDEF